MVRRMRKAEFGSPGTTLREQLVSAVLRGEKTATAGLLVDHERDGESLPEVESVAEWRAAHDRYWRGYADEVRESWTTRTGTSATTRSSSPSASGSSSAMPPNLPS
jgi:uncharacterized protein YhfF